MTSTTDQSPDQGRPMEPFSVGSVMAASFGVYARRFLFYTLITAALLAPSYALEIIWPQDPNANPQDFDFTALGVKMLIGVVLYVALAAVLWTASVAEIRGHDVSAGAAIALALSRLPHAAITMLLVYVLSGVGFALLFVPGVIVLLYFWVAGPVAVIEGAWPFKTFSRSATLTKGFRFQLLAILLIYIGFAFLVSVATYAVVGFNPFDPATMTLDAMATLQIANYIVYVPLTAYFGVLTGYTYAALLYEKEGAPSERLEQVFE